jgi:hypothetical protein
MNVQPPIIARYGYTWIQHPDGLYYVPPYPGDHGLLFTGESGSKDFLPPEVTP